MAEPEITAWRSWGELRWRIATVQSPSHSWYEERHLEQLWINEKTGTREWRVIPEVREENQPYAE
jgi:hypothetical protein